MKYEDRVVIKNEKGEDAIIFHGLHLNDNKEVAFKYDNMGLFSSFDIVLNEEAKAIEVRQKDGKGKKILLFLKGENEKDFNRLLEFKYKIIEDLKAFSMNLLLGKESLIAFPIGEEKYPFFITSHTMLEDAHYSIKYYKGFEYCVKEMAKKLKKTIPFKDFSELQLILGEALQRALKVNLVSKAKFENEDVVYISLRDLVSII